MTAKRLTSLFLAAALLLCLALGTAGCGSETPSAPGEKETEALPEETTATGISDLSEAETLVFGAYEQDNDETNGKEPIEWIVLAREDGKALVISKYALNCAAYNEERVDITWENCTLRAWLNGVFLNEAFSAEEQAKILPAEVKADANPGYATSPGADVTDRVFLLSLNEAGTYFATDEARTCRATPYADAKSTWFDPAKAVDGYVLCTWWFRTPGSVPDKATVCTDAGWTEPGGSSVSSDDFAVRPALWVSTAE